MGKKMQGSNSNGPTKAGKKHSYKDMAPINKAKQDGRIAGEQQFIRTKGTRVGAIVLPKDNNAQVLDILCRVFNVKRVPVKVFDTGYRLDEKRGRVVVPEGEFVNGY